MATVCASWETILADQIGIEITRLIRDSTAATEFAVVDFGTAERLAYAGDLSTSLPGCFVRPGAESGYVPADLSQVTSRVSESVRIQIALPFDGDMDPFEEAAKKCKLVIDAVRDDRALSQISAAISPHQVMSSNLEAVEWDGIEDQFLRQQGIAVKVVVARWGVSWLTRGP
jgi:hypothetical protein